MAKEEFLEELRIRLVGLPKKDIDERIEFYREMIEDRIDEGKSEEEAVGEIGTVEEVIDEIAKETPLTKLVKEKVTPKRSLKVWEIILIVLGFPIWFPLLLIAIILILVVCLLFWVFATVVYSIELASIAVSIGGVVVFFISLAQGAPNIVALGCSIMCAGLVPLLAFACMGITKVAIAIPKKIILGIKKLFIKNGGNK